MENFSKTESPILLLIDSYALLHRAYHAIPPLTSPEGEPTNAIYGFFRILFKVVHQFSPKYLVPAFDLPGPTFRHEKYNDYKAKRVKQEPDFYVQIDKVKEILQKADIKYFEKAGFEADDIIGTVSRLAIQENKELKVIIITGDLDTLQLVNERVFVYTFHQGIKNEILYDPLKVQERFGLTPSQLIDYKSLRGDQSDNILGVKGIGEKGALKLLTHYQSLEKICEAIDNKEIEQTFSTVKDKNLVSKLREQREQAYFSKCLVTIDNQVPIDFNLAEVLFKDFNYEALQPLFKELGFSSLIIKAQNGELDHKPEPIMVKNKPKESPRLPPSLF
jgi:DNA polymerase-1